MKPNRIECAALFALLLVLSPALLHGQAPGLINYQGMLTEPGGAAVADGDYDVTFAVYPDSVGGNALWSESRVVAVQGGLFSELLGSVTPLAAGLFDASPRWMGITVEDDAELTPRMKITSVPWALRASVADTALAVAGGAGAGDGHSLDAADGDPEDVVYVDGFGFVGVGTTDPQAELHVRRDVDNPMIVALENPSTYEHAYAGLGFWTADDSYGYILSYPPTNVNNPGALKLTKTGTNANFSLSLNGVDHLKLDPAGNLGVGTTSPAYKLDVNGTVNASGLRLPVGAAAGRVLTCDASGNASWLDQAGIADADWTVDGVDMHANVTGNTGIGTDDPLHKLHVVGSPVTGSVMIAPSASTGAESELLLAEDDDGTYGMSIRYNGTANRLELGGWAGANLYGPHLSVWRGSSVFEFDGSAENMMLDMDATGDASVQLPAGAVGAAEIEDEPGIADTTWPGGYMLIGSTPTVLLQRSIVCPGPGYVVALGNAWVQWFVNSAYAFDCYFALTVLPDSLPEPRYRLTVPGSMPMGTYNQPLEMHRVFPVSSAGTFTCYFLGEVQTSEFKVYDKELTLLYIPTAYGAVSEPLAMAGGPAPGAAEERSAAESLDAERMERELSQIRAEMDALRARLLAVTGD
jgi:hypothetical protein